MAAIKKTPVLDYETGQFVTGPGGTIVTVTGSEAVAVIAQKSLRTQLGKYPVYGNYEDITKNHIYGSRVHDVAIRKDLPEAVRISEIERETKEALRYDPRIKEVVSVSVYKQKDDNGEYCFFTDIMLTTIYNKTIEVKGGNFNG